MPRAIDDELVLFAIDDELELRSDSSTCGRYAPHAIAQTHGYVALAKSLRRGLAYCASEIAQVAQLAGLSSQRFS